MNRSSAKVRFVLQHSCGRGQESVCGDEKLKPFLAEYVKVDGWKLEDLAAFADTPSLNEGPMAMAGTVADFKFLNLGTNSWPLAERPTKGIPFSSTPNRQEDQSHRVPEN